MTIEDGYAIQRAWVQLELADGHTIKGRKIGLTSRAMQQASQITEPDYAPLMDDMFFESGADIPVSRFIAPRVEVELAFRLGAPLRGPGVTLLDVLQATAYVIPAWKSSMRASSGSTATPKLRAKCSIPSRTLPPTRASCLGGRPMRPDTLDLRWVGALLYKNAVIEESGLAAAVLNHPATGIAWLANKIAPYDEQLNAGDVVLSGSFTRPTDVQGGDVLHADFGRLGSIAVRFV